MWAASCFYLPSFHVRYLVLTHTQLILCPQGPQKIHKAQLARRQAASMWPRAVPKRPQAGLDPMFAHFTTRAHGSWGYKEFTIFTGAQQTYHFYRDPIFTGIPCSLWRFGSGSLDFNLLVEATRILHWTHKKLNCSFPEKSRQQPNL